MSDTNWDFAARQDINWRKPRNERVYSILNKCTQFIVYIVLIGVASIVSTSLFPRNLSCLFADCGQILEQHETDALQDLMAPSGGPMIVSDLLYSRSWWRHSQRALDHTYCWNTDSSKGIFTFTLRNPGTIRIVGIEYPIGTLSRSRRQIIRYIKVWGEPVLSPTSMATYHQLPDQQPLTLLSIIHYDADITRPWQNFTIPHNGSIEVMGKIVFEVANNWGDPHTTCVYAIRVYGLRL
jgi:hypothetical protein